MKILRSAGALDCLLRGDEERYLEVTSVLAYPVLTFASRNVIYPKENYSTVSTFARFLIIF